MPLVVQNNSEVGSSEIMTKKVAAGGRVELVLLTVECGDGFLGNIQNGLSDYKTDRKGHHFAEKRLPFTCKSGLG